MHFSNVMPTPYLDEVKTCRRKIWDDVTPTSALSTAANCARPACPLGRGEAAARAAMNSSLALLGTPKSNL